MLVEDGRDGPASKGTNMTPNTIAEIIKHNIKTARISFEMTKEQAVDVLDIRSADRAKAENVFRELQVEHIVGRIGAARTVAIRRAADNYGWTKEMLEQGSIFEQLGLVRHTPQSKITAHLTILGEAVARFRDYRFVQTEAGDYELYVTNPKDDVESYAGEWTFENGVFQPGCLTVR